MNIYIDATFVNDGNRYGSIERYLFRLLDAIPAERKQDIVLLLFESSRHLFEQYADIRQVMLHDVGRWINHVPRARVWYYDWLYRSALSRPDVDVILTVSDADPRAAFSFKAPKVTVIHDLKALKYGDENLVAWYQRLYLRMTGSAKHIVAISEYTKQDIVQLLGVPAEKISVVYNSVPFSSVEHRPQFVRVGERYILYVNTLLEYKNVYALLRAYRLMKDEGYRLVIVGRETPYWCEKMVPYILENQLGENIIRLENLSNEELCWLYSHAALFVTTSHREGFGYTPIEAAMHGCPVVSSRAEALPETTMGLLHYYAPTDDEQSLLRAIREALNTPQEQLEKIVEAFRNRYCSRPPV